MPAYQPSGTNIIGVDDFDTSEVISIAVAYVTVIPMFEVIGDVETPETPETEAGGFDSGGFSSGFGGGGGS